VQRRGVLKSNVAQPAQACSYEVCYKMKMLRNAAEIVGRFCANFNAFRCAFKAQTIKQEIVTMVT